MALPNFIARARRSVAWSPFFVIALLVSESPSAGAEFTLFKSKSKSEAAQDATAARLKEIDQATKGFADRYVTYLVDSCDRVQKDDLDPEARKQALRLKLFHSASVYSIASSPNPLGQLLDLCVVVTLGKMNWVEEGRAKKTFGADHSRPVIEAFNNAHTEVWQLAGRFLTPDEINETKKLIRQWRAGHKDLTLLAYVRFDDFAKARAGLEQENPVVKGLFSQIAEAGRTIQTATDFGERALYYTERMPRLLQWQAERTVQAVLENPELQRSLASIEQISKTIAEEDKKLDERQVAIQTILDQANQVTANAKSLVMEVRQTGDSLTQASASLTETFKTFDQLVHTLNPPLAAGEAPKPAGKPFDITEYGPVFEKATATAHEARLFIDSSFQFQSAPAFNNRIADIEGFTQRRTDHIAMRVAQLIVFLFAMLFLTRWLCARCFDHKSAGSTPPPSTSAQKKTGEEN